MDISDDQLQQWAVDCPGVGQCGAIKVLIQEPRIRELCGVVRMQARKMIQLDA